MTPEHKEWVDAWKRFLHLYGTRGNMLYCKGPDGVSWGKVHAMQIEGESFSFRCSPVCRFVPDARLWVSAEPEPVVIIWHNVSVPEMQTAEGIIRFSYANGADKRTECMICEEGRFGVRHGSDAVYQETHPTASSNVVRLVRKRRHLPRGAVHIGWGDLSRYELGGYGFHWTSPEGQIRGTVRRCLYEETDMQAIFYLAHPEHQDPRTPSSVWESVTSAEPVRIFGNDMPHLWVHENGTIRGVSPAERWQTPRYSLTLVPPALSPNRA
jgi:hypothetical protein